MVFVSCLAAISYRYRKQDPDARPYRFGRPRAVERTPSGRVHTHGLTNPVVFPFKLATFMMLLDRCKLSRQILDLIEHITIASYSASFVVKEDSPNLVTIHS